MDGEEDEHIYFSYKHLLYKNQINNSLLKVIYLSVISSYKYTTNSEKDGRSYFSYKHVLTL